jgi:hypothetical protein
MIISIFLSQIKKIKLLYLALNLIPIKQKKKKIIF